MNLDLSGKIRELEYDFEQSRESTYFSDEEGCGSSSNEDGGKKESLLQFAQRITEELRSSFVRNSDKEGFCEDVYEDKFSAPESGSSSYYADILAVARLDATSSPPVSSVLPPGRSVSMSNKDGRDRSHCNWPCSGRLNPSVGAGPLEDLFRVLQASPTAYPAIWKEKTSAGGIISHATPDQNVGTEATPIAPAASTGFSSMAWDSNQGSCAPVDPKIQVLGEDHGLLDESNFLDDLNRWHSESLLTSETVSTNALSEFRSFCDY